MLLGPQEAPLFAYGQNALATSPKMCEPTFILFLLPFFPEALPVHVRSWPDRLIQALLPANTWACTTALLTLCPLCIGATHSAVEDQAPPVSRHFVFYSQQCPVKQWQSHH